MSARVSISRVLVSKRRMRRPPVVRGDHVPAAVVFETAGAAARVDPLTHSAVRGHPPYRAIHEIVDEVKIAAVVECRAFWKGNVGHDRVWLDVPWVWQVNGGTHLKSSPDVLDLWFCDLRTYFAVTAYFALNFRFRCHKMDAIPPVRASIPTAEVHRPA